MVRYFSINEENCSVRCKLFCGAEAVKKLVLCCHGFGGNKDSRSVERFALRALDKNKGLAVVAFDWPAHGQDARKRLSLQDCDTYLRLMLAYITGRWAPEELYAKDGNYRGPNGGLSGYEWLSLVKRHYKKVVWLNPKMAPGRAPWREAETACKEMFPMYKLTVDGLGRAMTKLMETR